ncbi:3-phosphoserine/phosphohydroxythreonine transaminase [Loktanella sp. D2R18]|uniref:3-phosphoserine/phosphohydroxythreonine transaminase n=1 Tax=Rhodobacterales TaxID=204455 RepID=UPI000DEA7618|nr:MULTISPECIES: 3-phosphoserine/phosphohydroxythreonine transaminase [Rhodobacterales]MDO6592138.1 3-phosphoserine/phosphohydroxythreonine transaminase [Yoonia sp. 1_MG-2023]RBW42718.1 3-phosphoserine/phosphohydroxythreonine transaminase [Loktanella sp. D2R18]
MNSHSPHIHPALAGSLSTTVRAEEVINFSPGPTSLPEAVEQVIATGFNTPGLTSLALSHRSPEFLSILNHTLASVRTAMNIPEDYEILFTHGGGHGQFAAVPLNLCHDLSDVATYVVNGTWSLRGRDEAARYCNPQTINAADTETGAYTGFPELTEANIDPTSKFIYLCSNETVNGIELHRLPKLPESRKHIPLVIDASSDFSTKPIDWLECGVGVLFACASKNIGHPGLTLTIVRKDLLGAGKASPLCPGVFNYTTNSEAEGLWNTPATFNIEVVGHVMDWIKAEGGVDEIERRSIAKAKTLYDVIDGSNGFYGTPVTDTVLRSRMNVPFNIAGGDEKLTDKFLIQSWEKGMIGLRTLTPFGVGDYLRASLYNGVTVQEATTLADFMRAFAAENT